MNGRSNLYTVRYPAKKLNACLPSLVYGKLSLVERRSMWEGLQRIGDTLELPWLIVRDFNSPLSTEDKIGELPITQYNTL